MTKNDFALYKGLIICLPKVPLLARKNNQQIECKMDTKGVIRYNQNVINVICNMTEDDPDLLVKVNHQRTKIVIKVENLYLILKL